VALIQSLPAGKARSGFEKLQEDFKIQLEIGERADVDDISIALAAAEEIEQIRDTLSALAGTLEKTASVDGEHNVAHILRPITHWFDSIVSNDFPDLSLIRQYLENNGYGRQIRGGGAGQ